MAEINANSNEMNSAAPIYGRPELARRIDEKKRRKMLEAAE